MELDLQIEPRAVSGSRLPILGKASFTLHDPSKDKKYTMYEEQSLI